MSQAQILYQMQTLELRARANAERQREIAAALAHDERVAAAQAAQTRAAERHQSALAKQREGEHTLASNEAKAQATDARLYSGSVTNPKEMADMQQELAALARRREELEEELLFAMEETEAAQLALTQAQEKLESAAAASATAANQLRAEQDELRAEEARIRAAIAALLPGIEGAALKRYRTLVKVKRGRALALIEESRCSACGIGMSTGIEQRVRHGVEMIACQSCGRLLVFVR